MELSESKFARAWERLKNDGTPVVLRAPSGDRYVGVRLYRVEGTPLIVKANLELSTLDGKILPISLATPEEMETLLSIRSDIQKGFPSLGCTVVLEGSSDLS